MPEGIDERKARWNSKVSARTTVTEDEEQNALCFGFVVRIPYTVLGDDGARDDLGRLAAIFRDPQQDVGAKIVGLARLVGSQDVAEDRRRLLSGKQPVGPLKRDLDL